LYVKVPAVDGVPQIGNRHLYIGVSISPTEAVCHIDDGKLENGWIELTEEEWREQIPPVPEPIEPHEPAETIEQKLTRLESQNIILMDALATTFEEVLALRAIVEGGNS